MIKRFSRTFSSLQALLAVPASWTEGRAERQREAVKQVDIPMLQGLVVCLGIGLVYGLYFVLRYSGYWAEGDTVVFARAINRLQQYGTIFSPLRYQHGYAYTLWMATVSDLTAIPAPSLVRWFGPIVGNAFLTIFGYAVFRDWLGSNRLAMLTAATLPLVPELVFTVSRGNHEKLTVSLTLLASLVLIQCLNRAQSKESGLFAWALCYPFIIFVMVSLNSVFGANFVVSSTITFGIASFLFLFKGLRQRLGRTWLPLGLLVASSWGIFLLVTVYVYPQAGSKMTIVNDAIEGILTLFDDREVVTNPYESYGAGGGGQWVNSGVARVLSSFRWFLFGGSFATWTYLVVSILRRPRETSVQRAFLVALYAAYGIIMAVAFPIDFLGLSAGDNLSVRLYTYFSLFAVPMLILGMVGFRTYLTRWLSQRVLHGLAATVFISFSLFSLMKSTLDPLASNFWLVYWPEEPRAVHFWSEKQDSSTMYGRGRLRAAYVMTYGHDVVGTNYVRNERRLLEDIVDNQVMPFSHSLDSALHRAEAVARQSPDAVFDPSNRVYDNGRAQILHRVPQTPFQK